MTARAKAPAAPAKKAAPAGKLRYSDRWRTFGEEERIRVAGSKEDARELDELVEMLDDLDAAGRAEQVAELRPQLVAVVGRLNATVAHAERLRRQRRKLYAQLLILGEHAARVGTLADVTGVSVSHEAGITVKQR